MNKYTVIYLPWNREDKEWMIVNANSEYDLIMEFKVGTILKIE